MAVHLSYLAHLRTLAGTDRETVDLTVPATLAGLLAVLRDRGDDLAAFLFDDAGDLQPTVTTFVDDAQVRDPAHPLQDGAEVIILTPVSGG